MSDPTKLDIADYFAAAVGAIMLGVGSAMTWFMRTKEKMHTRMDGLDTRLDSHNDEIIKVTQKQEYLDRILEKLENKIEETALTGADAVNRKFDQIMNVIQNRKH